MTTAHERFDGAAEAVFVDTVIASLRRRRYVYRDELALHDALSAALTEDGFDYRREVSVVGGRIDFIVGRVGVEVKVKGSAAAVSTQLARYAQNAHLSTLLLVTTRPAHRAADISRCNLPVRILVIGSLVS